MKKINLILVAAVAVLAMAFTSCGGGLAKEKQGKWLPAKSVYTEGTTTKTFTISWTDKTAKEGETAIDLSDVRPSTIVAPYFKVEKKSAVTAKYLSDTDFAEKGIDALEWNDSKYDIKEDGTSVKFGTDVGYGLFTTMYEFKESDDADFAYMIEFTASDSSWTSKTYYNIH